MLYDLTLFYLMDDFLTESGKSKMASFKADGHQACGQYRNNISEAISTFVLLDPRVLGVCDYVQLSSGTTTQYNAGRKMRPIWARGEFLPLEF